MIDTKLQYFVGDERIMFDENNNLLENEIQAIKDTKMHVERVITDEKLRKFLLEGLEAKLRLKEGERHVST